MVVQTVYDFQFAVVRERLRKAKARMFKNRVIYAWVKYLVREEQCVQFPGFKRLPEKAVAKLQLMT